MSKINLKNNTIYIAVAVFGLAAVSLATFVILNGTFSDLFRDKRILATVGDENITIEDLNKRIYGMTFGGTKNNPEEVDEKTRKMLIEELIENVIIENSAKRLGIIATEAEIDQKIENSAVNLKKLTGEKKEQARENKRIEVLKEKVKEKVINWRKGSYFLVRFDRHFEENLGGTDTDRIADKEYATTLVNDLYKKITAGTITFAEAQKQVGEDKTIDITTYPGLWTALSVANSFDNSFPADITQSAVGVAGVVTTLSENEVSKPFLIKDQEGDKTEETAYMILKVNDIQKAEADSYEEWINIEKGKLNVENF